jgi:hypothetical protein
MKTINDNEIIETSRGHKRIGALFDENAMLHATNKDLLSVQADLLATLEEIALNPNAEILAQSRKSGHHDAYTIAGIARAAIAKAKGGA